MNNNTSSEDLGRLNNVSYNTQQFQQQAVLDATSEFNDSIRWAMMWTNGSKWDTVTLDTCQSLP
ncbi:hypothetical protein PSHT_06918 [Puccinia striiformis]|uniref:Uncharacterized protein n=1 Tax=Puccinia striiformis TaxID=27350 RepID=A0A2S4W2I1_9BASI|nr:hypothetical protein PSHT_06918 [Puccinia striiformis]